MLSRGRHVIFVVRVRMYVRCEGEWRAPEYRARVQHHSYGIAFQDIHVLPGLCEDARSKARGSRTRAPKDRGRI